MSKVEIVGPKGLLLDVLSLVRETGAVQLETDLHGLVTPEDETRVRSLVLDEEALARRLFYDNLRSKILDLFSLWPMVDARQSYLDAEASLPLLADLVPRHLQECRTLAGIEEQCRQRRSELQRFVLLLPPLQRLVEGIEPGPLSELVGVTVRRPEMLDPLRQALTKAVDGRFEILTSEADDGTLVALLVTDKNHVQRLREALAGTKIAELSFPREMADLSLAQKVAGLTGRLADLDEEQGVVRSRLERFARQWKPIYRQVLDLLEERLALLKATAKIYETDMCFFVLGWMPSRQVQGLRLALEQRFSGQVDLEELALLAEDLDRVPVLLRNPRYFAPFELFSRLLPLPGYASFDPTPFIGIFFPLFFGMILGDMGYGILLLGIALLLLWRVKKRPMVRDAARILGVCSVYTLIFGGLYGEAFGELGQRWLGMEPLLFDRGKAILPMIYFALSVGVVHVSLGLLFGFAAALRKKSRREALFKALNIGIILGLAGFAIALAMPSPGPDFRPLLVTMAVAVPLLFVAGGLLAPLELLKSIGNIISYVRIMAIGLTSVLLAYVANRLGGMGGDILAGGVVALLLHAFNLLLGVFAPTVHALRLHYVEFFSKFFEAGGRRFEPLEKKRQD